MKQVLLDKYYTIDPIPINQTDGRCSI